MFGIFQFGQPFFADLTSQAPPTPPVIQSVYGYDPMPSLEDYLAEERRRRAVLDADEEELTLIISLWQNLL